MCTVRPLAGTLQPISEVGGTVYTVRPLSGILQLIRLVRVL